jgi:hypothetical protein
MGSRARVRPPHVHTHTKDTIKHSKIWEDFDKKIKDITAESNTNAASSTELDKYTVKQNPCRTSDSLR